MASSPDFLRFIGGKIKVAQKTGRGKAACAGSSACR
jgi:hypothetical protein